MNKARRKQLSDIRAKIEELQDLLEEVRTDEQDAFDNLPESIASSERGQAMEDAVQNMDDAIGWLEEALGCLEEAAGE